MMFMFDIETLGVESTALILSASIIHFDPEENPTYDSLLSKALFVKFNAKEQADAGRTIDKSTLEWWRGQHEYVRKISLLPSGDDVSVVDGLTAIREYIKNYRKKGDETFWARGSLDQMGIDSLCKAFDQPLLTRYNNWRDVRTAIDCLRETARDGYCEVPNFDRENVIKHHPTHDCAYDIMMLTYGK